MADPLLSQYQIFLYSIIVGVIIGVYYDIFRTLRLLGYNSTAHTIVQDIIFTTSIAPLTYLFCTAFNNGIVRLYILIGEFIGFVFYRFTFGQVTLWLVGVILKPVKFLFLLIKKPFCVFYSALAKKGLALNNALRGEFKKNLQFKEKKRKNNLKITPDKVYNKDSDMLNKKAGAFIGRRVKKIKQNFTSKASREN